MQPQHPDHRRVRRTRRPGRRPPVRAGLGNPLLRNRVQRHPPLRLGLGPHSTPTAQATTACSSAVAATASTPSTSAGALSLFRSPAWSPSPAAVGRSKRRFRPRKARSASITTNVEAG
jgi:hypothetical protein